MPQLQIGAVVAHRGLVRIPLVVLDDDGVPYPGGRAREVTLSAEEVLAITNDPGLTDPQKRAALKALFLEQACAWKIPEALEAVEDILGLIPDLPITIPLECGE